jgi:protein O-mannosyl-transferase
MLLSGAMGKSARKMRRSAEAEGIISAKKTNRYPLFISLALALITVASFWGVHGYEFVNMDDAEYIAGNQNIQRGFTADALKWAFTSTEAANWHPVTWLSHMLDCSLFGLNPGAHHGINLLLHILNVLLLFSILKNTTRATWQSAFAACLFAVHPLHVESVAWVSERKDVLSTFFWMLTTIAYIRYCRRPNIFRYVPALLLFGLGLMSKPMLVTLPFVLLLMDYWPLERLRRTAEETNLITEPPKINLPKYRLVYLMAEKIPLFALAIVSSVITFVVQQKGGAMDIGNRFSLASRIANSLESYVIYIQKTLWPSALAPFYPHPANDVSIVYPILAAAVLLGITALVIRFGRSHKYLPVGWFWYLGMLVPVIGLVQVGEQAYADRYSYLATTGLFIMIAWLVPQLVAKWPFRTAALVATSSVIIAIFSICTFVQQKYWRDSVTLFEHAIKVTKNNYQAHYWISEPLRLKGKLREAIDHNSECLRIRPDHSEALNSMALAMIQMGRFDEAIECLEKAIKLKPHVYPPYVNLGLALNGKEKHDEAIALYRSILPHFDKPPVHKNLADALREKGDKEEAINEYKKYLAFEPSDAAVLYIVGISLAEQGKNDEAVAHFQRVLEIEPNSIEAHNSLGYVLAHLGRYDEATRQYSEALRLAPEAAQIHVNLGYVYVSQGNFEAAASEYRKAVEIQPDDYVAHTYLGKVLFRLGNAKEAIEHFNQALKINPGYAAAKNDLQAIRSVLH